ncbi:hypothetical protein TARUN_9039 [Trichoderma arundinaceum]|uniref:Uncharacterized protein n=1 Tax=Trichoderma arundinaceum TaxID=490622 RepID=A0A395NAS7_TRIAR|nr:hypothetical protein TARUN_9039 [Trichoderma arundinaceum]
MADPPSSPATSIEVGTATNPNTPRSGEGAVGDLLPDDQNIVSSDQVAINATPPSPSDASSQQGHDIQPTWPSKIDRTKIRAHACWHPDQNMSDILLDIHWAGQHSRAFFKLHTGLRLEGAPSASRHGLINVYIFIYPERIRQLSFTAEPQDTPFGPPTVAFTFELNRPPALVLPKAYTSFGQGAEDAMRSLRSLVQQSCFTVYASLPSRRLSTAWLQRFCKDVTEHKFTTIATLANVKSLYQGHGGQVTEGDGLLEPVISQDDAAARELPAYQETDPSIPPARSTKRKRSCDESSTMKRTVQATDTVAGMQALFGNMLEAKFAAHERKLGDMLSAHENAVQEMLSTHIRKVDAQLAAFRSDVEDKIKSVEERVKNEIMDELTETINERILEEVEGVQEHVMERITSMPVQAHFTFPNHPYL